MMKHPLSNELYRCPRCKSDLIDVGLMPDDDEYDLDLARDCGVPDDTIDTRFSYIHEHYKCYSCGRYRAYGQRYYWNEVSGNYDRPKPLTPEEEQRAERERERKAAEAAGQMTLFAEPPYASADREARGDGLRLDGR